MSPNKSERLATLELSAGCLQEAVERLERLCALLQSSEHETEMYGNRELCFIAGARDPSGNRIAQNRVVNGCDRVLNVLRGNATARISTAYRLKRMGSGELLG
jgi:hypothetical protein